MSQPSSLARVRYPRQVFQLVFLEQARTDPVALGLEEGEGHAAANQQVVGAAEQVLDHGELVRDLGTTQHHHIGALGRVGERLEHAHLSGYQVALVGRQQGRDVIDRGMAAVNRTEGIVHVGAVVPGQGLQLGGQFGALGGGLGGFAGVKAHVLQDEHLAVAQSGRQRVGRFAHHVPCNHHGQPAEGAQHVRGGADRVLGLGGAVGTAEMGHYDDAGTGLDQLLHHRKGGTHASIVGDDSAVQRHVQVAADQNVPPADTVGDQIVKSLGSHSL